MPDEYRINGATVVANDQANRLQIIFDEKPPREMRQCLKAHGFHWAPTKGAWQRMLNQAARQAAQHSAALAQSPARRDRSVKMRLRW